MQSNDNSVVRFKRLWSTYQHTMPTIFTLISLFTVKMVVECCLRLIKLIVSNLVRDSNSDTGNEPSGVLVTLHCAAHACFLHDPPVFCRMPDALEFKLRAMETKISKKKKPVDPPRNLPPLPPKPMVRVCFSRGARWRSR